MVGGKSGAFQKVTLTRGGGGSALCKYNGKSDGVVMCRWRDGNGRGKSGGRFSWTDWVGGNEEARNSPEGNVHALRIHMYRNVRVEYGKQEDGTSAGRSLF